MHVWVHFNLVSWHNLAQIKHLVFPLSVLSKRRSCLSSLSAPLFSSLVLLLSATAPLIHSLSGFDASFGCLLLHFL